VTDSRVWGPQLEQLSRSYRLIAIDQRGHGQSSVPGGSYEPVADAATVLGAVASDDAVVVALGDAAQVALRLAVRTDVTVRAVVLATPGVGSLISDDPEFDLTAEVGRPTDDPAREAVVVAAIAGDRDETARLLAEEPRALPPGHPARALFREMIVANVENVFREASLAPWDNLLASLRAPTLLVTNESPAQRLAAKALRRTGRHTVRDRAVRRSSAPDPQQPPRRGPRSARTNARATPSG
jgi:pimeloyl-ACP methyl ester carboxylesterase